MFKKKTVLIIIIIATVVLAGITAFTAIRLYQLRQESVSPAAPESVPAAAAKKQCGGGCSSNDQCETGLVCFQSKCANPACKNDPGSCSPDNCTAVVACGKKDCRIGNSQCASINKVKGTCNETTGTCDCVVTSPSPSLSPSPTSAASTGGTGSVATPTPTSTTSPTPTSTAKITTPIDPNKPIPESGISAPTLLLGGTATVLLLVSLLLAI